MKDIFVPYRNQRLFEDIQAGKNFPLDFLYGFSELKTKYNIQLSYSSKEGLETFFGFLLKRLEIIFARLTKLGMPLEILFKSKKELKNAHTVFALNDPIANAMLVGKTLGLFDTRLIVLYQSLTERKRRFRLSPLINFFYHRILRSADIIIVLSLAAKEEMIRFYHVPENKVHIFHFGVDTLFWKKSIIPIHQRNYVMTLGNDMNRDFKTFEKATAGFNTVAVTNHRFKGEHVKRLTNLSHQEVLESLQSARILVIPSIEVMTESSGLSSVLQGMSSGTPVIVSDSPTMRELFEEGNHIFYYKPEDAHSLKKVLEYVWDNTDLLEAVSRNARTLIEEKFNVISMSQNLDKILSAESRMH